MGRERETRGRHKLANARSNGGYAKEVEDLRVDRSSSENVKKKKQV